MESFIRHMLSLTIQAEIVDKILENSMDLFIAAFTTKGFDENVNYEFFEQIGDLSINKFIVTYMSKRFPHLKSSPGVGVLASLRILYGSKDVLSSLSEKYGLDKFIRCTKEETVDKNRYKDILEDVFEAFFGSLEFAIDREYFNGIGYITVYKLLERIFDEIDVSIDYKSLIDAKTRLNELKDECKFSVTYKDRMLPDGTFKTELFINKQLAAIGDASTKKMSQINASENALIWIEKNLNFVKEPPSRFKNIPTKIWS